jgi:very-short-patch-repair endonuclease
MVDQMQTWIAQRARELRAEQTPAEQQLWQQLRAKRFAGFKFRRQEPIGRYIADFVCFRAKLIVELDGSQHLENQEHDENRDAWLTEQGFVVLRFWNNQWALEAEVVLEAIWLALQNSLPSLSPSVGEALSPLPNPSPKMEEGLKPKPARSLRPEAVGLLLPSPPVGEGLGERGDCDGE